MANKEGEREDFDYLKSGTYLGNGGTISIPDTRIVCCYSIRRICFLTSSLLFVLSSFLLLVCTLLSFYSTALSDSWQMYITFASAYKNSHTQKKQNVIKPYFALLLLT